MVAFAPNPATALAGGFKSFTSGTTPSIEIPISFLFAFVAAIVLYTVIGTITIDLTAAIDFKVWMFYRLADRFIATHNALFTFIASLYRSTFCWAKLKYTSIVSAFKLLDELHRIDLVVYADQAAVVEGFYLPGGGVMVVINGLPSDLFMSCLSQYPGTGLCRYHQSQLRACLSTAPITDDIASQDFHTDTHCPDLRTSTRSAIPTTESMATLELLSATLKEVRVALEQHRDEIHQDRVVPTQARLGLQQRRADFQGTATVHLSQLADHAGCPVDTAGQDIVNDQAEEMYETSGSYQDTVGDEYDGMSVDTLDVDASTRD